MGSRSAEGEISQDRPKDPWERIQITRVKIQLLKNILRAEKKPLKERSATHVS